MAGACLTSGTCIDMQNEVFSIEDLDLRVSHSWYVKGPYAYSAIKGRTTYFHRLVAERVANRKLGRQDYVDHINGNRFDNRRTNIRLCTHAQNQLNAKLSSRSTTGFKGVSWSKERGEFEAYISFARKRRRLGRFPTAEEAARAYDEAAKRLHGEFVRTNADLRGAY